MENIILYVLISFTACFCIYHIFEYIKFRKIMKEQDKQFNVLLDEIADDLVKEISIKIMEDYKQEQCKNNAEKKQVKRGRKPKKIENKEKKGDK